MATLESILSGEREAAPAAEATTPVVQPETTTEQPQGQPDDPSSHDEPQPDERGMVPVAALQATREKAKRKYTETVSDFEKRMAESDARWEQRFSQIMTTVVPKQAQPEAAPAPDFWIDPEAAMRVQATEAISPLQQQVRAMAREVAEVRYQPDVVATAVDAFDSAVKSGQIDPEVHRRIMASPNPYASAVQWHQHTSTMSEIGADPAAYKAKLADEIRAQVMAEIQGGAAPAGTQPAQVMPSNFAAARNVGSRAGPAWSGPAPLQDIFARRK